MSVSMVCGFLCLGLLMVDDLVGKRVSVLGVFVFRMSICNVC